MSRVKVTESNMGHCQCPQCRVQLNSTCVKEVASLATADSDDDIGKLYCAMGKSACTDLDGNETCICSSCLVWDENNLSSMYYCLRGSAKIRTDRGHHEYP